MTYRSKIENRGHFFSNILNIRLFAFLVYFKNTQIWVNKNTEMNTFARADLAQ